MTTPEVGGYELGVHNVRIDELVLDRRNPRFVRDLPVDASQQTIAAYLDSNFNAVQVARSIFRNGFFASEPLIATYEDQELVVIEGNRRLAALMGLTNDALRLELAESNRGWRELSGWATSETRVPVVVVATRAEVVPLLGFRHITGLAEWEPYSQAKYVAGLIDSGLQGFAGLSQEIGRSETVLRAQYRNYKIAEQLEATFQIDAAGVRSQFGIWTAAMGRRPLYEYLGAPAPRHVVAGDMPLEAGARENAERLVALIFGSGERGPVISDSRELKKLADVVAVASPEELESALSGAATLDSLYGRLYGSDDVLQVLEDALNAVAQLRTSGPLAGRADAIATLDLATVSLRDLCTLLTHSREGGDDA